ncbi:MAG: hypothetical protein ACON4N_17745 [Myxococcota bacterium]
MHGTSTFHQLYGRVGAPLTTVYYAAEGGGGGGGGGDGGGGADGETDDAAAGSGAVDEDTGSGNQDAEGDPTGAAGGGDGEGPGAAAGAGGPGAAGGAAGAGGGAGDAGGTGGAPEVVVSTPMAPRQQPVVGLGAAPTPSISLDGTLDKALTDMTGLSAADHEASVATTLGAFHTEIQTLQEEQVGLAATLATEARQHLEAGFGMITTGVNNAVTAIDGAYQGQVGDLVSAREEAKGAIDGSVADAQTAVSEGAVAATGLLAQQTEAAEATLLAMESAWSEPFTQLESDWALKFEQAAINGATNLEANRQNIADAAAGEAGTDPVGAAKAELRMLAARKQVDEGVTTMQQRGVTDGASVIAGLGHAAIVQGWLTPLRDQVDTMAINGDATIEGAAQTANDQLFDDAETASTRVDEDADAGIEQLDEDNSSAQEEALAVGEQAEVDLETAICDVEAHYTETGALIADSYRLFAEELDADVAGMELMTATDALAYVATNRQRLTELHAENEGLLREIEDTVVSQAWEALNGQLDALGALATSSVGAAEKVGEQKVTAVGGMGTQFGVSFQATADGVQESVEGYTEPLGEQLDVYVGEVEVEIQAKLTEADTTLQSELSEYEQRLASEVGAFGENIDVSSADAGLEGTLQHICVEAWNAMRGWGTREDPLFNALRKIETAKQGAAVEAYWRKVHSGATGVRKTIRSFLTDDLNESERNIAFAYLRGDRAAGANLELNYNMRWYGDDEAQIEAILRSLSDEDRTALQNVDGWASTQARLESKLDGTDLDVTQALLANNVARADAYRLRDAINAARRSRNDDALHKALAGMDASQREAIAQEFALIQTNIAANDTSTERPDATVSLTALADYATRDIQHTHHHGHGGTHTVTNRVTGANKDLARALVMEGNDSMAADVARFEVERTRRGGPNEENMETALMMSAEEQQILRDPDHPRHDEVRATQQQRAEAFNAAWQDQYGGQEGGPESVNDALGEMYEGQGNAELQEQTAKAMLEDGTNSARVVAMTTQLAVDQWGTDEEQLKRIWAGLTPQEADQARELWQQLYGEEDENGNKQTLDDRLFGGTFSEMSGDEAREQRVAMLGDSQYFKGEYADRHLQATEIELEYTVGDKSGWFSGAAGDETASIEVNRDKLYALLAEVGGGDRANAFNAEGHFVGTDEQYAEYTELCAILGINAATHRARIDSIASAVSTSIAVAGAVLAAFLTGGAATPLIAAAIAGGTGAVTMAANATLRGGRYGWEAAAYDAGMTAISASLAGAGEYVKQAAVAARGAGQVGSAGGAMGRLAGLSDDALNVTVAGASGTVSGMAGTALNDKTWNNGLGAGVGETLYSGFVGGTSSSVGAFAGRRIEGSGIGQQLSQGGALAQGTVKGISGGTSAMASESTVISSDALFRGRTIELDEAAERVGLKGVEGAGQGFLEGVGEAYHNGSPAQQQAQVELDEAAEQAIIAEDNASAQIEDADTKGAEDVARLNDDIDAVTTTGEEGEPVTAYPQGDAQDRIDAVADDVRATHVDEVTEVQGAYEDVQQKLDVVEDLKSNQQDGDGDQVLKDAAVTTDDSAVDDAVMLLDEAELPAQKTTQVEPDPTKQAVAPVAETDAIHLSDDAIMDDLIELDRLGLDPAVSDRIMDMDDPVQRRQAVDEARAVHFEQQAASNEMYTDDLAVAMTVSDPQQKQEAIDRHIASIPAEGHGVALAALARLAGDPSSQAKLAHDLAVYHGLFRKDVNSLTTQEVVSLCHAHHALYNEFALSTSELRKVVPVSDALKILAMRVTYGNNQPTLDPSMAGSVADSRNSEGMTPPRIIEVLGLDYGTVGKDGGPDQPNRHYIEGELGSYVAKNEPIFVVEMPVNDQIRDNVQIPLATPVLDKMIDLYESDPIVAEVFDRSYERNPTDDLDSFTGVGGTTTERLGNNVDHTMNQELFLDGRSGKTADFSDGTLISVIGKDGTKHAVARYVLDGSTEPHFVVLDTCPDGLRQAAELMAKDGRFKSAALVAGS